MTPDLPPLPPPDGCAEFEVPRAEGGFILRCVDAWSEPLVRAYAAEAVRPLLDALEAAQKDAERYRWIRQVAEGESSDGEHCPIIKLYGLQGAAEDAFLLKVPHLTDAIDAAMKGSA